MLNIRNITLHLIRLPLLSPFSTANGDYTDRETIVIEMADDQGRIGWGECVAFSTPWYTEETTRTAWHVMEDFLIPALLDNPIDHPTRIPSLFATVKRHAMAKAGLEMAAWDLYAKQQAISLAQAIGGTREKIEAGVAIGLQATKEDLLRTIEGYVNQGYKRVKVKIKPGMDIELIDTIRQRYPELPLMADANSSYSLDDHEQLKKLDPYQLLMIEQPLGEDDIIDHAKLQREIETPICLDESIVSYEDARQAIELGSCKVINIKLGRVGGLTEAIRIHDLCQQQQIPVWCGGMLESGVGRAHNIALASMSQFVLPGDLSASSRYWARDIIHPEVNIQDGMISVPTQPGIGFEVDLPYLNHMTLQKQTWVNRSSHKPI